MSEMIQMLEGLRSAHGFRGASYLNGYKLSGRSENMDKIAAEDALFAAAKKVFGSGGLCSFEYCACERDNKFMDSGWQSDCRARADKFDADIGAIMGTDAQIRVNFENKLSAMLQQMIARQAAAAGYVAPEDPAAFQARLTEEGRRLLADLMAAGATEEEAKAEVAAWMQGYGAKYAAQASAYTAQQTAQRTGTLATTVPVTTASRPTGGAKLGPVSVIQPLQPMATPRTVETTADFEPVTRSSNLPLILGGLAAVGVLGYFIFRK